MTNTQPINLTREIGALRGSGGISAVEQRAQREALATIERDALAEALSSYRILPVGMRSGETVEAGDLKLCIPELAAESGELIAIAAAACTVGPAIEARATALFAARKPLLALALDAAGNELLFRLADRTFARIRRDARRRSWKAGAELSPGNSGIGLDQQPAILSLSGAAENRIALTSQGMLVPAKSLCFVVTLGRNLSVRSSERCDHCASKDRCQLRNRRMP